MNKSIPQFKLNPMIKRVLLGFMLVGLVVFIIGLFVAPERVWANFLISEFYLLSLGVGAGFFIASMYVSNAGWGTAIRRIPEAITSVLPIAGIGALLLYWGIHSLYEWSHYAVVSKDSILAEKQVWLNEFFFMLRLVVYFTIWIWITIKIVNNSRKQDYDDNIIYTKNNVRNSAIFIVAGAITFSLASFDLLMSLQPHWYSTVFGLLSISGMITSTLAVVTIILVFLRNNGYKQIITKDHMVTMGTLMMSFSLFWVYMWVSQHMLIWYANIPEETSYYTFRHFGGWGSLSFVNLMLNWAVPFLILLPRAFKLNDKIILYASIILVIGHWLDLYIIIMPTSMGDTPQLGIWEIALFAGSIALVFWVVASRLSKESIVPKNDPYLVESLPKLNELKFEAD